MFLFFLTMIMLIKLSNINDKSKANTTTYKNKIKINHEEHEIIELECNTLKGSSAISFDIPITSKINIIDIAVFNIKKQEFNKLKTTEKYIFINNPLNLLKILEKYPEFVMFNKSKTFDSKIAAFTEFKKNLTTISILPLKIINLLLQYDINSEKNVYNDKYSNIIFNTQQNNNAAQDFFNQCPCFFPNIKQIFDLIKSDFACFFILKSDDKKYVTDVYNFTLQGNRYELQHMGSIKQFKKIITKVISKDIDKSDIIEQIVHDEEYLDVKDVLIDSSKSKSLKDSDFVKTSYKQFLKQYSSTFNILILIMIFIILGIIILLISKSKISKYSIIDINISYLKV